MVFGTRLVVSDLENATTGTVEKGVTVTEQSPAVRRRHLLGTAIATVGGVALSGCVSPQPKPDPSAEPAKDQIAVTPPEDLMREHGVLKRILLIYREGIRCLQADDQAPTQALNASAQIIRSFIEDYHEHLEEQYVFPKLERAGKLTDITTVLRIQHQRGRIITDRVLLATAGATVPNPTARQALIQDMSAFTRMYEPHEAREDTIIFPALRDTVPVQEFRDLAEIFEDEEHRRFGPTGFQDVVDKVADIEMSLGIHDLSQFTPNE